jgi:hypothetical protein
VVVAKVGPGVDVQRFGRHDPLQFGAVPVDVAGAFPFVQGAVQRQPLVKVELSLGLPQLAQRRHPGVEVDVAPGVQLAQPVAGGAGGGGGLRLPLGGALRGVQLIALPGEGQPLSCRQHRRGDWVLPGPCALVLGRHLRGEVVGAVEAQRQGVEFGDGCGCNRLSLGLFPCRGLWRGVGAQGRPQQVPSG